MIELEKKAENEKVWYKPSEKLPKNREEVLLRVKLHDKWNREVTLKGYRDFGECLGEYEEDWGYCDDVRNVKYDFVDGEEVVAWAEIPVFKE